MVDEVENNAWHENLHGRSIMMATVTVAVATPLAFFAHHVLPHANLSLVFLIAVLLSASRFGMRTALYTSALSFLSFNFFFTAPYYSLNVEDDGDIATLVFFLIVAGLSGRLAARMQEEMAENRFMVQRLTNINNFSRLLATAPDSETILQGLSEHIAKTFSAPTWVILRSPSVSVHGHDGNQPRPPLSSHILEQLQDDGGEGAVDHGYHINFNSPHGINGQVYLQGTQIDAASHELVRILCDLAAVTLERARLVSDLEKARLVSESEQLRSALLSSVSHDLRTPLSTIIGATSSLLEYGSNIQEPDRTDLMQNVLEEAERLNRYIQNLLDMTRLGGGTLEPRRDWVDLGDIISTATERLQKELSPYKVDLQVPDSIQLLYIQGVLIEQALVNVLDNAARFSPRDGTIRMSVVDDGEGVTIDVCDQGPGIPENERERVFDMFYTATRGDRHSQGTGLGLAICRGLLNAHGGQVTAHEGLDGKGTCIRLYLPHHEPEQEQPHHQLEQGE
jgi:two-component system sensor histidine kinase KdpD